MTASITDFNQFTELRAAADRRDPAALREVAGQFEALFLQMMLKNMRAASFGDPMMGDNKSHEMYRDMMDQQLSLDMASGKGIGLAEMIIRQLGGQQPESPAAETVTEAFSGILPARTEAPAAEHTPGLPPAVAAASKASAVSLPPAAGSSVKELSLAQSKVETAEVDTDRAPTWDDPVSFAQSVWPHVKRAAARLNVSPVGVLAQAALETGWGAKVMQAANGASSYNLFGIKAANGWQGDTVAKSTVEFDGAVARRETAQFRAYPGVADTFDDYAAFLGKNPRYESVRGTGDNVEAFANALADSGYATDPRYADKITDIFKGPTMQRVLESLGDAVF